MSDFLFVVLGVLVWCSASVSVAVLDISCFQLLVLQISFFFPGSFVG